MPGNLTPPFKINVLQLQPKLLSYTQEDGVLFFLLSHTILLEGKVERLNGGT